MLIAIVVTLILSIVYNELPERTKEKIRNWIKDTLKWAAISSVVIGVLFAMVIFLPNALGEELPQDFYYRVVFVDEVEGIENELLVHTDDLDHLWDYWEDPEVEFEEFDKELSDIALWFVLENDLYAEFDKEEVLCRGRIIVLTMWEADPEDHLDDEIVGVYYSELITR